VAQILKINGTSGKVITIKNKQMEMPQFFNTPLKFPENGY
jgi:hypothetical protein